MKGGGITARGIKTTPRQNFVNMRLGTKERGRRKKWSQREGEAFAQNKGKGVKLFPLP